MLVLMMLLPPAPPPLVLPCHESRWQRWKNARAKMKLLWKQYGLVWLGTYTVLYFGGLAGVYVILDTGLIPSDVSLAHASFGAKGMMPIVVSGYKCCRAQQFCQIGLHRRKCLESCRYPHRRTRATKWSPTHG